MATPNALDYRTAPDDQPRCATHPLARGTEQCVACGGPACDVCATFTRAGVACAACEPRLRRRRWGAVAVALAVVAGLLALLPQKADLALAMIPAEPAGHCEEPAVELRALEQLLAGKDREGARARAARFEALCEGSAQILYLAAMNAGDAEVAVEEAEQRSAREPGDAKSWEMRARAHARAERPDLAILDYRRALSIQRGDIADSEAVAELLERSSRGCEAALTLADMLRTNYLIGLGEVEKLHRTSKRAKTLWLDPACRAFGGSGTASFAIVGGRAAIADVALGTSTTAPRSLRFELDTMLHASVLVTRAFADRTGLALTDQQLSIRTPWGAQTATIAAIDTVRFQGASVSHVVIGVVDDLSHAPTDRAPPLEGEVGLDLLRRFHQTLVNPDRLELAPLRDWAELSTEGPLDDIDDVNANLARSRGGQDRTSELDSFGML